MNRKKALLIISTIESLLTVMAVVFFINGSIRPVTFAALVLVIALVSAVFIFIALRKLPPM